MLKVKVLLKKDNNEKQVFIHDNWKSAWNRARTLSLLNDNCFIISKYYTIIVDAMRKNPN